MWIPKTTQEIIDAVNDGHLQESQNFDAKRELGSRNKETAKDIAAMANDGGVLIYGLEQDDNGHITGLAPIRLNGAAEKIDQIAHTSVQETPRIQTFIHELPDDPDSGFLVVVVPPSERAPHMVTVDRDNRYYMRLDKISVPMPEGEVARLYERRRRWEVDQGALLDRVLANPSYPLHPELNNLYLYVRPVSSDAGLLSRMGANDPDRTVALKGLIGIASNPKLYPYDVCPPFGDVARRIRPTIQGLVCESDKLSDTAYQTYPLFTTGYIRLDIQEDGMVTLFCSRVGALIEQQKKLFAVTAVSMTWRCLAFAGMFYQAASYFGLVDIGLGITKLKGQIIDQSRFVIGRTYIPFPHDTYRRTIRVSAPTLPGSAEQVARDLLMPLMNEMTMGSYDPFTKP